jgi:hypothetical protein
MAVSARPEGRPLTWREARDQLRRGDKVVFTQNFVVWHGESADIIARNGTTAVVDMNSLPDGAIVLEPDDRGLRAELNDVTDGMIFLRMDGQDPPPEESGQALPGCGHAERALQASWWQEHGAADARGARA